MIVPCHCYPFMFRCTNLVLIKSSLPFCSRHSVLSMSLSTVVMEYTVVANRTCSNVKPSISPSNVALNANPGTVLETNQNNFSYKKFSFHEIFVYFYQFTGNCISYNLSLISNISVNCICIAFRATFEGDIEGFTQLKVMLATTA